MKVTESQFIVIKWKTFLQKSYKVQKVQSRDRSKEPHKDCSENKIESEQKLYILRKIMYGNVWTYLCIAISNGFPL